MIKKWFYYIIHSKGCPNVDLHKYGYYRICNKCGRKFWSNIND